MLFWLDNNENHKDEPNENFGRELLELFSMGVGNYTEEDVKNSAYAFTGWSFVQPAHGAVPYGKWATRFEFRKEDHDFGEKTFLGVSGALDGTDIIDTVVEQPATARFISRHLYNFFVADEPPVAAWNEIPPRDPQAIDTLMLAYFESGGSIAHMLEVLFNSDFFVDARFEKVKSPTELVGGVVEDGRNVPGAASGHRPVQQGRGCNGAVSHVPADGRRVADRRRMDQRGDTQRARQLCGGGGVPTQKSRECGTSFSGYGVGTGMRCLRRSSWMDAST